MEKLISINNELNRENLQLIDILQPLIDTNIQNLELHLYSLNNELLSSEYSAANWSYTESVYGTGILIDLSNNVNQLGYETGRYSCKYKLNQNLVGSNIDPLVITEISPSGTEIRLTGNIGNLLYILPKTISYDNVIHSIGLQLNIKNNQYFNIINWVIDQVTNSIIVKIDQPVEININTKGWIVLPLSQEINIPVELITDELPKNVNVLKPANFNATPLKETKAELKYSNYSDLLGSNKLVFDNINNYISSSNSTTLNIDYRDFSNFIFYGSAVERLNTFKYKITKIENYNSIFSSLNIISSGSQSLTGSFEAISSSLKEVVDSFDHYERYLYYQSASYESSSYGEFYAKTWPKENSQFPYRLYSVTSSIAETWFDDMIVSASYYDKTNQNKLISILPPHIVSDTYNSDYITFIHAVGHQFDNILPYVYQQYYLNSDESISNGLPKELIYHVLNSYGWDGENDNQFDDLWYYTLATDSSGNFHDSGSYSNYIYVNSGSQSTSDINYEIWKRILNNLIYLNKTKGTKQGTKALINCYGIPETLLPVKEYGGAEHASSDSVYDREKYNYSLQFTNTGTYVEIYTDQYDLITGAPPTSVEFRFKPNSISDSTIMKWNTIELQFINGYLYVVDSSTTTQLTTEILDTSYWYNVLIQINGTTLTFNVYSTYNGEIKTTDNTEFITTDTILEEYIAFGHDYVGLLQEIKVWYNEILTLDTYVSRVLSPTSFFGNTITSAYDNLVFRYCLGSDLQKLINAPDFVFSQAPNKDYHIYTALFDNITTTYYTSNFETYKTRWPDLTTNRQISNKTRIEDSTRSGQLSLTKRVDTPAYDLWPLDLNKIGIYFSSNNEVNEDIAEQLGGFSIDDYIGDWELTYSSSYQPLESLKLHYFSKYESQTNIYDYYRLTNYYNNSLFKQLEKIVPARANAILGTVVESHILNRSKVNMLRSKPSVIDLTLTQSIDLTTNIIASGEYIHLSCSINTYIFDNTISILPVCYEGTIVGNYSASLYNVYNLVFINNGGILSSSLVPISADYSTGVIPFITSSGVNISEGLYNIFYNGCKVSSAAFNAPSNDTPDGKPVVELFITNPLVNSSNIINVQDQSFDGHLNIQ